MFVYGVTCISTVHLVVRDGIWSTLLCSLDYFLFIGFGVLCSVWHCYSIFLTCCSSCGSGGIMAHVTDVMQDRRQQQHWWCPPAFFFNLFDYFQRRVPCPLGISGLLPLEPCYVLVIYSEHFFVCIDLDHMMDGLKKDSMEWGLLTVHNAWLGLY